MIPLDVLAIGAHPDDIELGCGGSIINLIDDGYQVGLADLTPAALSTRGTVEIRKRETEDATGIMGAVRRYQLGFSESTLLDSPDNVSQLVTLIRKLRPHIIFAPFWEVRHADHRDAEELVRRASFWAGVSKYGDLQSPHRPHRIMYYYLHRVETVSLIVDISSSFDRKLRAIRAYKSQFLPQPSAEGATYISRPEFIENLISRARYYGSLIGVEYGEPFNVNEAQKVDDVMSWANIQGVVG